MQIAGAAVLPYGALYACHSGYITKSYTLECCPRITGVLAHHAGLLHPLLGNSISLQTGLLHIPAFASMQLINQGMLQTFLD